MRKLRRGDEPAPPAPPASVGRRTMSKNPLGIKPGIAAKARADRRFGPLSGAVRPQADLTFPPLRENARFGEMEKGGD
jgi:hypothetical protein